MRAWIFFALVMLAFGCSAPVKYVPQPPPHVPETVPATVRTQMIKHSDATRRVNWIVEAEVGYRVNCAMILEFYDAEGFLVVRDGLQKIYGKGTVTVRGRTMFMRDQYERVNSVSPKVQCRPDGRTFIPR